MIERLVIHRFRGIREGVLEDIGKVNLLIGPNNSGKTAILEMMYLAGLCGRPCSLLMREVEPSAWPAATLLRTDFLGEEPTPRLRERHGEPAVWEESPAVLTEEHSLAVSLESMPEGHPMREFELSAPLDEPGRKRGFFKKDITRVTLFRLGHQKAEVPGPMLPPLFAEKGVRLEETFWTYLWEPSLVYRWEAEEGIDHLAVWAIQGQLPAAEHVLFSDFHTTGRPFTEHFAKKMYESLPGWEDNITAAIRRVFPQLENATFTIRPHKGRDWTGFVERKGVTPLAIDHFGDGARHAFKVLATLIALAEKVDEDRPGLFLWEDPELFMHPASLQRLLAEVMNLVAEKPIQVFLSSQSLEVVGFLAHYFREKYARFQESLRAFRLELDAGRLYAAKFRFENLLAWLEQGMDPRYWGMADLPITYRYREAEKFLSEED